MSMKPLALAAAALLLAACGKTDEDYLTEACIARGEQESFCRCSAEIYAESISPRQLELLAGMRRLQSEEGLTEEQAPARMLEEYSLMDLIGLGVALFDPIAQAERECS